MDKAPQSNIIYNPALSTGPPNQSIRSQKDTPSVSQPRHIQSHHFLLYNVAFYDGINSKCLYGCNSRYSLNFSSWRKPFAGADLVQMPWTGWK